LVAERVGCDRHHCGRFLSKQLDRRNADSPLWIAWHLAPRSRAGGV